MNSTKKSKKRTIWQRLRMILLVVVLLFFGLIGSAMFFEKQIGDFVINALKEELNTEVEIGEASLSFIRSFPQASVSLHQILIKDERRDTALYLDDFSLQCSIMDVVNGAYEFKGVYAGQGILNIHIDHRGNNNVKNIWKTGDRDVPINLRMSISNAQLESLNISYKNNQTNQFFDGTIHSGQITGDFIIDNSRNMNIHTVQCDVKMTSDQLVANGMNFLNDQPIDLQGDITVDNATSVFTFENLIIWINNDEFSIDGSVAGTPKGSRYDIRSQSQSARLSTLMECVPLAHRKVINGIESYADVSFEATIQGEYTSVRLPEVRVSCQFNGGRITHPSLSGSLRDVSFSANYSNGNGIDQGTQVIEINDFRSTLNGEPITLDFDMTGTKNPYINATLDGVFSMSSLYSFFGEGVTDGFGSLQIDSFMISGYLQDMVNKQKIYKVKQQGTIYPREVGLEINGVSLSLDAGEMHIRNNDIDVDTLAISTQSSMININGLIQNLLPVLFTDQTTLAKSMLLFDFDVTIDQLDLNEIWQLGGGYSSQNLTTSNKDSIIQSSFSKRAAFLDRLRGQIQFQGRGIEHPNFTSDKVKGLMSIRQGSVQLQDCIIYSYGGYFEINSNLHFTKTPYGLVYVDAKDIDVFELFKQTNGFGQDVLTHQHLKGQLDALLKMDVFFDSTGLFDEERFFMLGDVCIKDGELNDFEMLESFAKYIKIQDLQQIKFTELNNQFKIENRTLLLPAMFIQSNASNLLVGGTYTFDHDVDFKIKINAGQLFFNNFKKYNPQRKPLKARKNGLFNVYAQIYGNMMDEIEYRIGPKFAKKSLDNELSVRLPQISNSLKNEFGVFKNNGIPNPVRVLRQPEDWEDALYEDMEEMEYIQW